MSKKTFKSAELVSTSSGLQYHIGLKPGNVAPYILLCGDPARVAKVARYFDKKNAPIANRDYVTVTGIYKGIPISVMATGMGADNTEIAVVELSQIVKNPTYIRIGSSGALKVGIELGDLVISQGAVRLENTSLAYVSDGYPAFAHHEVVIALIEAARQNKFKAHVGITATASGFYGAQGRKVPGFVPSDPDLPAKLDAMNVSNLEMESSCLFTLASLSGTRAGAVCAIFANRHKNIFIDGHAMEEAEKRCIETGLAAFECLAKIDKAKGSHPLWTPSMGV